MNDEESAINDELVDKIVVDMIKVIGEYHREDIAEIGFALCKVLNLLSQCVPPPVRKEFISTALQTIKEELELERKRMQ